MNIIKKLYEHTYACTSRNSIDLTLSENPLAWILHEGGIYKNKMAISLISGHGYVNFHLNYV
ncbi:MAG: hypothetical protein LN560_04530 [Rickettsia endosymbiont of Sceptobius lativentris]|nr:hypothetical protein [Rickettsia endosymbiont of Sceptobius lativentris]